MWNVDTSNDAAYFYNLVHASEDHMFWIKYF